MSIEFTEDIEAVNWERLSVVEMQQKSGYIE
jgi:hypothetical protein